MIRPAILLLFVTIGSLTAGALRPRGELGVAAWRAGPSAKVARPDAPAGEVGRQILPTAGPDAELCASMTTGGGAEPLFPWHAAVLPREAAPALGTEERARALLLAGRGEEAWSVLTSPDVGSGPQATYLRAWAAAAGGRPEAALLLEPFTAAAVPLPCRAPALRLAARELATSGDLPGSLAQLAALRAALPEIPDYVLLWSIEAVELSAAASRGSAVDAPRESTPRVAPATGPDPEALYRDLLALHPPAGVVRSADLARAGLFERARQAPRARSLLAALVSRSPRAERPALLLRLARVEASPASREQRQREIVERHPDSEEALALLAPQLAGEGSRLRLSARDSARVLAAHGRARDAVQALTPTTDPALLALRGEIRLRNDEYLPAARDFQEAIARGGASAALSLELAKAYGRGGEPARARSIYQRMYSEGGARGGATLTYMIADAFHDESALSPPAADSAATWFRRLVDRHAGSTLAPRGLLRLAHLRFARREWVRAESAYREHLRRYPGSEDRRETRYWLARTLQEAGRAGEARELLSDLLQPGAGDYYALLARRRLGGGGESAVASLFGQDAPPPGTFARAWSAAADTSLPAGSPAEGRLRRARALLLLGEREDAQR
ncbi:MAG: hypothetical protein ABR599_11425, partial [Gemmatimonadota bacterium]